MVLGIYAEFIDILFEPAQGIYCRTEPSSVYNFETISIFGWQCRIHGSGYLRLDKQKSANDSVFQHKYSDGENRLSIKEQFDLDDYTLPNKNEKENEFTSYGTFFFHWKNTFFGASIRKFALGGIFALYATAQEKHHLYGKSCNPLRHHKSKCLFLSSRAAGGCDPLDIIIIVWISVP